MLTMETPAAQAAEASAPIALPAHPERRRRPRRRFVDHLLIWTWAVFFFLMTSPFTYMLMGVDPEAEAQRDVISNRREEGSQLLLYGLRYAVLAGALFLVLARFRAGRRRLPALAPLLPYVAWAAASIAWTDEFASTLHGLLALVPVFIVAYGAVVRMPPQDYARAFLLSGLLMAAASLAFIFLLPMQGVHQQADVFQSVHAGAWRGIYMHKNHLGQTAALYCAAYLLAGRSILRNRLFKWAMVGLMFTLVLGSQSASAIVIVPVAAAFALMAVCLTPLERLMAFLYTVLLGASAMLLANILLDLLGRDMTLSGRTRIWAIAANFFLARPIGGYGYMSTNYGGFSYSASGAVNVYDPHNGYVDTMLGLGLVGIVTLFGPALIALLRARRQWLRGSGDAGAALVLTAAMSAWLLSCLTESNARPLGAVTVLGMMAMAMILIGDSKPVARRKPDMRAPGPEEEADYDAEEPEILAHLGSRRLGAKQRIGRWLYPRGGMPRK